MWLGRGLGGIVGGIRDVVDGLLLLRVVLGLGLVIGVGLVLHIVLNFLVGVGIWVVLIHLLSHYSISSLHTL